MMPDVSGAMLVRRQFNTKKAHENAFRKGILPLLVASASGSSKIQEPVPKILKLEAMNSQHRVLILLFARICQRTGVQKYKKAVLHQRGRAASL